MKSAITTRKKRKTEEIIASILEAARHGATKTRIMYVSFLSFSLLEKYINYTLENGLIGLESEDKKYLTTHKGFEFLKRLEEVHGIENNIMEKKRSLYEILENNDEKI